MFIYIVYQIFQNELKDHNLRYRSVYKLLIRKYISGIYICIIFVLNKSIIFL